MREKVLTLNQYQKEYDVDQSVVLQMGIDLCHALEDGAPHGNIGMGSVLVSADGKFFFRPDQEKSREDMAADIYALGMLMYRMLNHGRLPFASEHAQKMTPEERKIAMKRCLSGEPLPDPDEGDEETGDILRKACHADRSKRYQTPGEMGRALCQALAEPGEEPVQQRQGSENWQNAYDGRQQGMYENWQRTQQQAMYGNEQRTQQQGVYGNEQRAQQQGMYGNGQRVQQQNLYGNRQRAQQQPQYENRVRKAAPAMERSSGFGMRGIFVLLSAVMSLAFLGLTLQTTLWMDTTPMRYLYGVVQIILLLLCMKAGGFLLKMMWLLSILDILYVLLYGIVLEPLMNLFGIFVPGFYHPGYLAVILPLAAAVIYMAGDLMSHIAGRGVARVCTVLMIGVAVGMLLLKGSGSVGYLRGVPVYPYAGGILMMVCAVLAMENRRSSAGTKAFSFLAVCDTIAVLLIESFKEQAAMYGLPVDLAVKGMLGLLVFLAVLACLMSGRGSRRIREGENGQNLTNL